MAFTPVLTDPLLEGLSAMAKSMNFQPPTIYLESCTREQLTQVGPERIVQHTREAVYFTHAVRRLEQRFGSCLWLEAGFDSPITSMTKRAVDDLEKHHFQDMRISGGTIPATILSTITTKLWQQGISSSFWGFYPPQETNTKQIWLPPYQFERTSHSMTYTDHALEIQERQAVGGVAEVLNDRSDKLPKLIEPRKNSKEAGEYSMNTEARRYVDIVSGHAVLNKPLCPAAIYMECAVMAAQLSLDKVES